MLEQIGLTSLQEEIYRAIVADSRVDREALRSQKALSAEQLETELQALMVAGLIAVGVRGGDELVVSEPEAAIAALIHRQHRRLEEVKLESYRLAEQLRLIRQQTDVSSIIELIVGSEAIEARWQHAQRVAKSRIRMTDRPPYYADAKMEGMRTQMLRMAEGIRYEVLYDSSLLEDSYHLKRLKMASDAGEDARVGVDVPIKLALIDDDLGFLVLLNSGPAKAATVIVVHRSALLDSLMELFNLMWQRGQPVTSARQLGDHLDEQRRELVALMTAGLKDEAIALEMGVTARTIRRWIQSLYADLGVRNRFQAGIAAAKKGWI